MSTQQRTLIKPNPFPPIPDKRYFTIGEASVLCGVKPHVLRYWEQEFTQLNPDKRRGNRRYYQSKDIALVRQIRQLLYDQGYTIEGARLFLAHPAAPVVKRAPGKMVMRVICELEEVLLALEV